MTDKLDVIVKIMNKYNDCKFCLNKGNGGGCCGVGCFELSLVKLENYLKKQGELKNEEG